MTHIEHSPEAGTIEIYVSPAGDDRNPGTIDKPLASLECARKRMNGKRRGRKQTVRIYLREGTHYLPESFVLSHEDSGDREAPVIFASFPGEKAVISGGRSISAKWEPFRDGIYKCIHSEEEFGLEGVTELFVNGRRQTRARFPNGDLTSPLMENYTFLAGADARQPVDNGNSSGNPPLPHKEVYVDSETFTTKSWSKPEEGVLHVFPNVNWSTLQFRIRGRDDARNAILLGEGGWQQHEKYVARPGTDLDHTSRFYIDNIFEELDSPGEWFWDRERRTLYYYPPEQVDLNTAVIEVPVLERLVEFRGTSAAPVRHIEFRGIRFAHAVPTYFQPYDIPSFGDWAIVRSGAVYFNGAEHCRIDTCFFDAPGGNALFIDGYNRRIQVENSLFTEAGESAIAIVGKSMLNKEKSYDCAFCGHHHPWGFDPHTDEYAEECIIRNNLIHDIGIYGKQTAGLFMAVTAKNTICHNEMYNIPRAAICIHDGTYGGHLFEYNYLHHTCRETDEHGTFNAWGRDSWWCHNHSHGPVCHEAGNVTADAKYTTIVRNNLIRDFKGWGIDLDDGASNYDICGNVCLGVPIKIREGDLRTVRNNIVVGASRASALQVGCVDNQDRWFNNIFVGGSKLIEFTQPPKEGRYVHELDKNLYFNETGEFDTKGMTFEAWQSHGFDRQSVFADPLFICAEEGDFRVKEESPALKLGFRNFPMNRFGLQNYPALWRLEEPKLPIYDQAIVDREQIGKLRQSKSVVRPKDLREYELLPQSAYRRGGYTRYLPGKRLQLLQHPESFIEWQLQYDGGGRYEVELEYSCAPEAAGGSFIVRAWVESIGTEELRCSASSTGGEYASFHLGSLSLSGEQGDKIKMTLQAQDSTGQPLLHLARMLLKRQPV